MAAKRPAKRPGRVIEVKPDDVIRASDDTTPVLMRSAPVVRVAREADHHSLSFRKANQAIGLRVSQGRFSLLGRKIFNVMVSRAQKMGAPGKNAPPDHPLANKYFWLPMTDMVKDSKYESNDTQLLKRAFEEMQDIRLTTEEKKEWTSERLLSSVKIVNTKGLNNKQGTVYFGYAFPPQVEQMLLNPEQWTTLSLYFQAKFKHNASLPLYESCKSRASSPGHKTSRETWEWWYQYLSGNAISEKAPLYKYFKRDLLLPSITEVNAYTDIDITLIEHKEGRRVAQLQFEVHPKRQSSLDFPEPPVINSALIERIAKLGIAPMKAADITAQYNEELILASLEMTEARMKSKAGAALVNVPGYFHSALKQRWATPQALAANSPKGEKKVAKRTGPTLRERFEAKRMKDAGAYFDETTDQERDHFMTEFAKVAPKTLLKPLRTHGMASPLVRGPVLAWLSNELWGPPTDAQILEFVEELGV